MAFPIQHRHNRIVRRQSPSFEQFKAAHRGEDLGEISKNVVVHCGWGRFIVGHTFENEGELAEAVIAEASGDRDIALYVSSPQVVLSHAPQQLFLDPSDTFRIWMNQYTPRSLSIQNIHVRRAANQADAHQINRIYKKRHMMPIGNDHIVQHRNSKQLIYLVAEETSTGAILGTVMGINHRALFNDPCNGSSLWCLAVDPQCKLPNVGEALVRYLVEYMQARGCEHLDLSVLHDNEVAKKLYRKLNFKQIQTFAIKKKNAFNEKLFVGKQPHENLNPYARIIIDEALSRGIEVSIDDEQANMFTLTQAGRIIRCHESLTDLTSAVTMSLCQNKFLTHRCLQRANLRIPTFQIHTDMDSSIAFLQAQGSVVVKPADSEQGKGICVDIRDADTLQSAIAAASKISATVMLESYHPGFDLRVVVIGYEVVAAAIRRPAEIVGDGLSDARTLIEKQSRRRAAATGGESKIPMDEETRRCLQLQGMDWDSVIEPGQIVSVRKTANLHTGGVLIDVTDQLHPVLAQAAVDAAKALQIPVTGIDLIVPAADQPEYVIIEANERPGLANHEPQPTAQKFIDLLFPLTTQVF